MRIKHIRKFLPVGHGAFFIERLFVDDKKVLTVVYDCGDSQGGQFVKQYANREFIKEDGTKERIDILFLSHFDSDHVNGLGYIQPFMNRMTKVFMPFYYDSILSAYNRNKRVGIENVIVLLDHLEIKPILVRGGLVLESEDEIDIDEGLFDRPEIRSGQSIVKKVQGHHIWRYVPFNLFNDNQFYLDFKSKVKSDLGWSKTKLEDASNWTKEDIRSLRRIYASFCNYSINENSMMVLSDRPRLFEGIVSGECLCIAGTSCLRHYYRFRFASCLYTGDTVLKRGGKKSKYFDRYETFLKELNRYVKRMALMQIPHHGSKYNINTAALCDCMSLRMICNYGMSDTQNKTFCLSKTNLESIWKPIIRVTEQSNTEFEEKLVFHFRP